MRATSSAGSSSFVGELRYSLGMSKPLIPTPVVDKNGRLTTVHKKAVEAGTGSVTIPAPTFAEPSFLERQREIILWSVAGSLRMTAKKQEEVKKTISGYSDGFLPKLVEALEDEDRTSATAHLIFHGKDEREVGEMIRFLPSTDITGFTGSFALIKTLHGYYPGLPDAEDYSLASADVQSQCESLLHVTCAVRECSPEWFNWMRRVDVDDDSTMILKDERLVALALERHDVCLKIVDVIYERESADFDIIGPALSGVLGEGNL